MKAFNIFLLLICSMIWAPILTADDYPEGHIARQLEAARKPIEVQLLSLKPGHLMLVKYVDMPVWIYRRTAKDLNYLSKNDSLVLADPKSENLMSSIEAAYGSSSSYVWARLLLVDQPAVEKTPYRSLKKEYFIVGGWSPHSGCALTYLLPENRKNTGVAFQDPCVGASFDLAGRIVKGKLLGNATGVLASYNLYIPPHEFKNDTTLIVGLKKSRILPEIEISKKQRYLGMTPTEKLITASIYDDLEMVKLALKEGANAGFFAVGKGSPLDAAIIGSSIKVIDLLIANGAKPTPNSLNAARFVGREEVVKLLEGIK